jgi:CPA2 family monovalent cation:H+ antiporter-2
VLRAAGLSEARVLVIALDDANATTQVATFARKERPDLHIIARARDRHHVFDLYKAGANDIVREMFDSSLRAGRYVLEQVGLTDFEAAEAEKAFYKHDRMALRELAKVWRDDIKLEDNQAYRQRVQELEQELEALLITTLSESRADADKPE